MIEAATAECWVLGFKNVTPNEIHDVNTVGDTMTAEVIMDVAVVEDALENARQGETVEAASPLDVIPMQQLSRILAG